MFSVAQQTSTTKFTALFEKLVRALRVNEIKVNSRSLFIGNLFALESEKESKYDDRSLFSDYLWIDDQAVNP